MVTKADEFKVGMILIVFALAAFFVLYFLGDIKKETGREYKIQFDQVGGITENDSVRYAGVNIGKVKKVDIGPAKLWDYDRRLAKFVPRLDDNGRQMMGDQAFVTILITNKDILKPGALVFKDTTEVTVATSLMNERWIEIRPGMGGRELKPCEILVGRSPITTEKFLRTAESAVDRIVVAADSVNRILGDEETQKNIKLSLDNFRQLTSNLKDASSKANEKIDTLSSKIERLADNANMTILNLNSQVSLAGGGMQAFTESLKHVAVDNQKDVRAMVKNLVATSQSLKNTLHAVECIVTSQGFNEDVTATLHNIRNTSREIEGIASDIRAMTSDGEIRENLKTAVCEAKEAAAGANTLLKKVNGFLGGSSNNCTDESSKCGSPCGKTNTSCNDGNVRRRLAEIYADAEYNYRKKESTPNLNAYLLPYCNYSVKLGIDNVGYDNLWNAQLMKKFGCFYPKAGIIRSKLGGGAEVYFGKDRNAAIMFDAYNPRRWQYDVTGRVVLWNDFYLDGGVRDVSRKETRAAVFGVGKRF